MKLNNLHLAVASGCLLLGTLSANSAVQPSEPKSVTAVQPDNPVLPGFHADPEIMYSNKTGKYYIYSTTDGTPGWGGHYFHVFSSPDLAKWTDEGIMLDLKSPQVSWANGNAWAPAIIERKEGDGYKYYFYYSGHSIDANKKQIGVAVADDPTGPFTDLGHPIVKESPVGHGQQIDVDVFQDPVSGKYYLYWGNGYMAGAELNDDLTSIKDETITVMTPEGGTLQTYAYREAPYVFFRNGTYYFMWSVDDTGSPNYHVAYGTAKSPLGKIEVADPCTILIQDRDKKIYGPAHNSVINLPGTDEWLIVYHRINENYIDREKGPGIHREVCIDRLEFNPDGSIKPVVPTKGTALKTAKAVTALPYDENDMGAYLMVFFTDPTHDLFMATSPDGYTFTAVNDGRPIIGGDTIAEQHGIRDPHISRGPDGAFYLAMTDLHIFGKQKGYRDTQWERSGEEYGWGNNRGLVLMKSHDLINWTRSNLRIDKLFPESFGNIGCAWAPETTYDPDEGKMMIYFTMRIGNGKSQLYYAYTDDDFTRLVTEPKLLFDYPDPKIQVLDADITPTPDGRWCMAYVAQENPGGIKVAFSDKASGPWEYRPEWVDFEPKACEAPNVWKRIGDDKWVVMYDIFSIHPHNFGFAETSDFKTFTHLGHFNEGVMTTTNFQSPKHGAIIPITLEEKKRLEEYWSGK